MALKRILALAASAAIAASALSACGNTDDEDEKVVTKSMTLATDGAPSSEAASAAESADTTNTTDTTAKPAEPEDTKQTTGSASAAQTEASGSGESAPAVSVDIEAVYLMVQSSYADMLADGTSLPEGSFIFDLEQYDKDVKLQKDIYKYFHDLGSTDGTFSYSIENGNITAVSFSSSEYTTQYPYTEIPNETLKNSVDSYFRAIEEKDADTYKSLLVSENTSSAIEFPDINSKADPYDSFFDELKEEEEEKYGFDVTYTYEIKSVTHLSQDKLDEEAELFDKKISWNDENNTVTNGYHIVCDVTVSGNENSETFEYEMDWYNASSFGSDYKWMIDTD